MDHLIRFTTAEGVEGSHFADTLDDAISFVEHLRNVEGAADVRLFRLTEVPIEFRTYYRVELGGSPAAAAPYGSQAPGFRADEVRGSGDAGPVDATAASAAPPTALVPLGAGPQAPAPDGGPDLPHDLSESAAANSRRLFSRT